MFDVSVCSRCNFICDPLLGRPFHKDFNDVCFIMGGCILAKIFVFKYVSHDF